MNGRCGKCGKNVVVSVRRGDKISNHCCPDCGTPLEGATAGQAQGRYVCPIAGCVVTLGLTGVRLEAPMLLVFRPGLSALGDTRREQPTRDESAELARVAGKVLGPGAVVAASYLPSAGRAVAGLALMPADTPGDPQSWLVNKPAVYKACAACGASTLDHPDHRPAVPWVPARQQRRKGHTRPAVFAPVDQGPHPAGSLACRHCRPHRGQEAQRR